MDPVGKATATVGGVQPYVSLVLQGGDTIGRTVCIGFLGAVGRDDDEVGEQPSWFPMTDHRKVGETASIRFVRYTVG